MTQRWEYRTVVIGDFKVYDSERATYKISAMGFREKWGDYYMKHYQKVLNELGSEGWELTTAMDNGQWVYIFKRPVAE